MKVLVVMCIGVALASPGNYARYNIDQASTYFEEFIITHNKSYATEAEKAMRFEIFIRNLKEINRKNQQSGNAVHGITMFSDLTNEEFIDNYTGLRQASGRIGRETLCNKGVYYQNITAAPESFDWRDKNIVTSVKSQDSCGSCWAFSATGNLESQYAIKYGKLLDLSEQQLVDCDERSGGCKGTLYLDNPFMYWIENSGAMLETDYPYANVKKQCAFDASKVKVNVKGCALYQSSTEEQLKELLYQVGPLTISVDATSLKTYNGNILPACSYGVLNHAVLLVGYGSENGVPFWLIKNSWGPMWGEQGYVRVKRGVNACGLKNSDIVTALLA